MTALAVREKTEREPKRCLSCGTTENMGRKRYCSLQCRQKLHQKLDMRCGLLQALGARYATFYFSENAIIMDVLPWGDREIYSFLYPRTKGKTPGDDFGRMANILGETWWEEQRRTKKRHSATLHVLDNAVRNRVDMLDVKPHITQMPDINQSSLTYLDMEKSSLASGELRQIIRNAYRRQVKIHHPDLGGDAGMFRKIYNAYEELLNWADNPSFIRRRGFPDKWFYEGGKDRWFQPTPLSRNGL
jgi:hypothetical protein